MLVEVNTMQCMKEHLQKESIFTLCLAKCQDIAGKHAYMRLMAFLKNDF